MGVKVYFDGHHSLFHMLKDNIKTYLKLFDGV